MYLKIPHSCPAGQRNALQIDVMGNKSISVICVQQLSNRDLLSYISQ